MEEKKDEKIIDIKTHMKTGLDFTFGVSHASLLPHNILTQVTNTQTSINKCCNL